MANFNLNKAILGGRLTHDPELKNTSAGIPVCTFTIAINRRTGKDEESRADFINCTAWRQTAEFICRYFRKSSSICVIGFIQTRSWTDQNGQKRFATEVQVDEALFVDAKNQMPGERDKYAAPPANSYIPEAYQTTMAAPANTDVPEDSDEPLPF